MKKMIARALCAALMLSLSMPAKAANNDLSAYMTDVTDNIGASTIEKMKRRLHEDDTFILGTSGVFSKENWRTLETELVFAASRDLSEAYSIPEQFVQARCKAEPLYAQMNFRYGIKGSSQSDFYYTKGQFKNEKGTYYKNGYYYMVYNQWGYGIWLMNLRHAYRLQSDLYYLELDSDFGPGWEKLYVVLHDNGGYYQLYEFGHTESISPENLRFRLSLDAAPSNLHITVDGQPTAIESFNIGGSSYVKLRDIATLLNDTSKQFSVSYDSQKQEVLLQSGLRYSPVGGELQAPSAAYKWAQPSPSSVRLDGKSIHPLAYSIGGNNFFRLRDLGSALGFSVDWDASTNTIGVKTQG